MAALALLVPGLGHVLLSRRRKGIAFFGIVAVTFLVGLELGGPLSTVDRERPLTIFSAAATWASGIFALGAHALDYRGGDLRSPFHEYGTTYILSAGLMNMLLVIDTLQISSRTK